MENKTQDKIHGMIDVSSKKETLRYARAQAVIKLKKEIVNLIKEKKIAKGDILEQAKVAGIMAAKKTPDIIAPHGGRLIDREIKGKRRQDMLRRAKKLKRVALSEIEVADLEMIANGA